MQASVTRKTKSESAIDAGRNITLIKGLPSSQKTLRIDVDLEPHVALWLRRLGEPLAQIGGEIERARRLHQQAEAVAAAHQRERGLGRAEHAHRIGARRRAG